MLSWTRFLLKKCRTSQKRRQKNYQGVGTNGKGPKNSKKDRKIALLSFFQGAGGNGKKDQKNTEK